VYHDWVASICGGINHVLWMLGMPKEEFQAFMEFCFGEVVYPVQSPFHFIFVHILIPYSLCLLIVAEVRA